MKIIQVCPYFWPVIGGMEEHVLNISLELRKLGHEIVVFTSNLSEGRKIRENRQYHKGIKIERCNSIFKMGDFASLWPSVFQSIRKKDFDILHLHAYRHPHNLLTLIVKDKPIALTPHWPHHPKGLRKSLVIPLIDKAVGRSILKSCDMVIAINKLEIPWLKRLGAERIELIPNGIPRNYLRRRDGGRFKQKYGIEGKLVLCVGRIHRSKGFDRLIRVIPSFKGVKFAFVGSDAGHQRELQGLIGKLKISDQVIFTGQISNEEEKLSAYAACDIFVLPSRYEAFSIVLLEAMSQGKSVIGSNVGGIPWVIGNCGYVFNTEDELKEQLKDLLDNNENRRAFEMNARQRAEQFTWDKVAKKLEALYYNICANNCV